MTVMAIENHPDYNSPAALKAFLDEKGMAMQKKFGQNFLINQDARKKIIDALQITEGTSVWEVGPGLGAMTDEILSRGSKLRVFEIDRGFAGCVRNFFSDYAEKNLFFVEEGDVLKTWKDALETTGLPDRFFGNLPYNIAASLIADTIEKGVRFERCVFTVQKEVAQRMAAKPSTDDYSSFSVLCQWAYDVKPVCDLGGANFWPRPNVDSRAVVFTKKQAFPECKNPELFMKMQRSLFSSRRKTIKNNLTQFLSNSEAADKAIEKAGLSPFLRAEAMTIKELLNLSDCLA